MRLVMIEWQDSFGCSATWQPIDSPKPKPLLCRSVGWLSFDGPDCKLVIPHISDAQDQGCGDMTIPTASIVSIVDLVPKARRSARRR